MIFMGPTKGVCFQFQFGNCSHSNHHEKSNGELLLHICQPCYQIRQNLVHHTCSGHHPGHSGDEKRLGAIGCPLQVSQQQSPGCSSSAPQPSSSGPNHPSSHEQNNIGQDESTRTVYVCKSCQYSGECDCVTYRHTPDALCPCDDCARFVRIYHNNLEKLCRKAEVDEFDLYSTYYDYHCSDEDSEDNDSTDGDNWDSSSTISYATSYENENYVDTSFQHQNTSFQHLNTSFCSDSYYYY